MPPLVSIQNPGSEKLQEQVSRALAVFVLWGGNGLEKNRVQEFLDSVFFSHHFPPMPGTLFFFSAPKRQVL